MEKTGDFRSSIFRNNNTIRIFVVGYRASICLLRSCIANCFAKVWKQKNEKLVYKNVTFSWKKKDGNLQIHWQHQIFSANVNSFKIQLYFWKRFGIQSTNYLLKLQEIINPIFITRNKLNSKCVNQTPKFQVTNNLHFVCKE